MDIQAKLDEAKKQYSEEQDRREMAIRVKAEAEAKLNYLQGKIDLLQEMDAKTEEKVTT